MILTMTTFVYKEHKAQKEISPTPHCIYSSLSWNGKREMLTYYGCISGTTFLNFYSIS